jgi:hypothetical protein
MEAATGLLAVRTSDGWVLGSSPRMTTERDVPSLGRLGCRWVAEERAEVGADAGSIQKI